MVAGGFAGSDAGNKSAVLLNHTSDIVGIELYLSVEIRKEDNEKEHKQRIKVSSHSQPFVPPNHEGVSASDELHNHLREHNKAGREDNRHNPAGIDLDGDMRGLSAVHFVAFDLFCVLNGYPAFAQIDENDKSEQ